jgi:catechol 2,3-dioxygenase-like lactoylglutathione lyase family enzyme
MTGKEDRTMEPRVNVITLAVEDLERALAFYRDGLGLPTNGLVATDLVDHKTGAAGAIVIFKLDGGLMLSLYPRSELGNDQVVLGVRGPSISEVDGEPLEGQIFNVFTLLGGRIVRIADYRKRHEALAAAGVKESADWH